MFLSNKRETIESETDLAFLQYLISKKKTPSPWVELFMLRIYKLAYDPLIIPKIQKLDGYSFKGSKGGPKKSKS